MKSTKKNIVVTGVSTGIGLGTTSVLVKKGWHVFGNVRKKADGDTLKKELGENFTPLVFDVEDNDAILAAAEQVRKNLGGKPLTAWSIMLAVLMPTH